MLTKRLFTIASAALFALYALDADPAHAQNVDMQHYTTVQAMTKTFSTMRGDFENFGYNLGRKKQEVTLAKAQLDKLTAGTNDYLLAEERVHALERRVIKDALEQLTTMMPTYQQGQESAAKDLRRIIKEPNDFQDLVKGYLRGTNSPSVMGALVYMYTRKLNRKAMEVHAKLLAGSLDFDLKDLNKVIASIDSITDDSADVSSMFDDLINDDDLWGELGGGEQTELERMLENN